jgi:hypothetical protein
MPPFVHVLAASFHFMWAFSQSALVFGASAANVTSLKPTARPKATIIETMILICFPAFDGSSSRDAPWLTFSAAGCPICNTSVN